MMQTTKKPVFARTYDHSLVPVETIEAKMWDVVVCGNGHICMLVVRPFTRKRGHIPYNSNFVRIDGGEQIGDDRHWGAFRCRQCDHPVLMDKNGFRLRIRKPVDEQAG
jgi:hypothetical protein